MENGDHLTRISRPFRLKTSSAGSLRWGFICRRGDNTPFGMVLYWQPDKRTWTATVNMQIVERVTQAQADFAIKHDMPEGSKLDTQYLLQFLTDKDKAEAMAAAIEIRGKRKR